VKVEDQDEQDGNAAKNVDTVIAAEGSVWEA
jgi:hypothetical protein